MERLYGKPIDIAKFKRPVLDDIQGHLKKISSIVDYLAANETPIPQNTCYICGSSKAEDLVVIHGFQYVTCLSCSHIYTNNRYSDEAIRRFYEKNVYWAEVTYANRETCFYRRDNVALPKVEYAEKYVGAGQDRLWVDIGSGIGDLVSVAGERGWKILGLELSETQRFRTKKNGTKSQYISIRYRNSKKNLFVFHFSVPTLFLPGKTEQWG